MPDVFLYAGEPLPNDVKLSDPTVLRGGATVILFPGQSRGVATVSATLVRDRERSATVNGAATVSATVVRTRARSAIAAGVATVTSTVVRVRGRTAAINGTASVSANVVRTRALTATAAGVATVSAAATVTAGQQPAAGSGLPGGLRFEIEQPQPTQRRTIVLSPDAIFAGATVTAQLSVEHAPTVADDLILAIERHLADHDELAAIAFLSPV